MLWLSGILIVVGALWLWSLLRGAPYVPTLNKEINTAFSAMNLKPGDLVVDLGSGDGRVLKIAAERGFRAVGYEINPLLVFISRFRLRKYKDTVKVHLGDFRYTHLPSDTKGVYIFTAGAFLKSMQKYLRSEVKRLGHSIVVVSFGYELPNEKLEQRKGALMQYRLQP